MSGKVEEWEQWIVARLDSEPEWVPIPPDTWIDMGLRMASTDALLIEILVEMTPRQRLYRLSEFLEKNANDEIDKMRLRIFDRAWRIALRGDMGLTPDFRPMMFAKDELGRAIKAMPMLFQYLRALARPEGFEAFEYRATVARRPERRPRSTEEAVENVPFQLAHRLSELKSSEMYLPRIRPDVLEFLDMFQAELDELQIDVPDASG